jgi:hypothetical protein
VDPRLRTVTTLPVTELWNDSGPLEAMQLAELGEDGVRTHLRLGAQGVLASIGKPLRWLRDAEFFEWWKSEGRPRLVAPKVNAVRLDDFPGGRCWSAREWRLADGSTAILFEEHH